MPSSTSASLGFGHARGIVEAVDRAGIGRAIYFSTTSLLTILPAASKVVRQQAEDDVQASNVPWTIFRPTMIYGDPGDRNLIKLIFVGSIAGKWSRCSGRGPTCCNRCMPMTWRGAVVAALDAPAARNQAYNLGGGTALTYNELVGLVGELLGRKPPWSTSRSRFRWWPSTSRADCRSGSGSRVSKCSA